MAKHKARVPWRHVRRKLRDLMIEHQRLQRAYRDLESALAGAEQERVRLAERYEPEPGTTWGAANAAAHDTLPPLTRRLFDSGALHRPADLLEQLSSEMAAWDPDETQLIPVVAVGIDPATGTDPAGISVIKVNGDGTAEVIKDES